ncbi:hypothetical protein [Brevibacterium linens]|uniref:Uncharacterized protein n=2 Tax=Brevibacterium linens TaxID=1703 RepID=A0A2H1JD58_BRELN|nr:hypothetical protein [Brevibacterium linens]AZU02306.1 hypothetical protein CXR29_05910 [Brevibacterium linens]KAB1947031.1 hypothetical protein F8227_10985 [Brevibacterium linens ATCC 9172]SMX85258.1 hypothetical protein BLIN101_02178 [Brevibacterium linens]SMX91189.1 hypothetical protein BLIN9172_02511 [Brevibacterium linens ATCC 9172]
MFGLPTATVVIIAGIPAIWVIYTLVFVFFSRGWRAEDVAEDQSLASSASGTDGRDGGAASAKGNGGAA